LDTLLFTPDSDLFTVVWRSTLAIESEDASDVREVRLEYEALP